MSASLNAAIFDFGGVITTSPMAGIHLYEERVGVSRGSLLRLVTGDSIDGNDPWHRLERGELDARQFWSDVKRQALENLGIEISLADLTASFAEGFKVRQGLVELIAELGEHGVPLALLTNNVKEFGSFWKRMIPVNDLFDTVVDSSEVGMRKPDPRIYKITLERLGSRAEETIFVDDTYENVIAAEKLGMTGIHFGEEDHESQIVDELRRLLSHHL